MLLSRTLATMRNVILKRPQLFSIFNDHDMKGAFFSALSLHESN